MNVAQILQGLSYIVCSTTSPNFTAFGSFILAFRIFGSSPSFFSLLSSSKPYLPFNICQSTGKSNRNKSMLIALPGYYLGPVFLSEILATQNHEPETFAPVKSRFSNTSAAGLFTSRM